MAALRHDGSGSRKGRIGATSDRVYTFDKTVASRVAIVPPLLSSPNVAVGVTVGATVAYDASKSGGTFANATSGAVTYRVDFENGSNGLAATGATITGVPSAPAVTWMTITATNSNGASASDRFAIVAFASGLPVPSL